MNKIKKTIRNILHLLKVFIVYTLGAGAAAFIAYSGFVIWQHEKNEVEAVGVTAEVAPIIPTIDEQERMYDAPKETDVEKAARMLAEATSKLDAQEAKLLAEIEDIQTKAESEVAEREAEIEEINEIRSSF